jgi:predicted DsbA family dithiol-disulfide isomerase
VEAEKMGISGTPTFLVGTVEANGEIVKVEQTIMGAYPYELFKAEIDGLLASVKKQEDFQ